MSTPIVWLYVNEPHLGRRLLAVRREEEVTIYWRMRVDQNGRRPFDAPLGSPRWCKATTVRPGESTTFGDIRIRYGEDGRLEATGQEPRASRHGQMFVTTACGIGEPELLNETWGPNPGETQP